MQAYYFADGNTYRDYRITINLNTDLTFDITVQYKENPNTPILFYDHQIQSNTSNFYLQFNHVDYGNYRSYYDNINIWNGYKSPTPIN